MDDLSRVQRDLLVIAAGFESASAATLRAELEEYYYSSVSRQHVRDTLDALVDRGLLTLRHSKTETYYELTADGRRRLAAHREWVDRHCGER